MSNLMQSHSSLFAGRVNNAFHNGAPAWKPNHPKIKGVLKRTLSADKSFLKKLERMQTTNMKVSLILEVVKMYAPELARVSTTASGGQGAQGKGTGKSNNKMHTNNNNNKGKGKGKGYALTFAQMEPDPGMDLFYYPDCTIAPTIVDDFVHLGLTGVKMMSITAGLKVMEEVIVQGGKLGDQPLAILAPPTHKEALDRLE